jgi:hypothetical protein
MTLMVWITITLVTVTTVTIGWWLLHYLRTRDTGFEDRYMELYGKEEWEASNMELRISFDEEADDAMKIVVRQRLQALLKEKALESTSSLFHEVPQVSSEGVTFSHKASVTLEELLQPRKGVYFDMTAPGLVRVVWNHLQADGVRLWRSVKPLFDPNPPIVDFDEQKLPLPLIPEVTALPTTLKTSLYRSNLEVDKKAPLKKGFRLWSTTPIKELKKQTHGKSFNLVSSTLLLAELFERHPEKKRLTVGMILAFPFLRSNNQYGVFTFQVKRGSFQEILRQVERQMKSPVVMWGNFSVQSQLLSLLPDEMFMKTVGFFRGQLDVLISNLPVGKVDIKLNQIPCQLSVFMDELSVPYYFLLIGTRSHLHLSYCSKFEQERSFLCQETILHRLSREALVTSALPEQPPIFPSITPTS